MTYMPDRLVCAVLCFTSLTFSASLDAIMISEIESKGFIAKVDETNFTYKDFAHAISKAFPLQKHSIQSSDKPVLRHEFVVTMVEMLSLSLEASQYKEICTMANDESKVPSQAIGAFTVAFRSNHQLMQYRKGRLLDPFGILTKSEAAYSFYMALHPPKQGGQITSVLPGDPPGLNSLFTGSGITWSFNNFIGDGYTIADVEGDYYPRMIKRIPSIENGLIRKGPDGTYTITFELRKNMKWHDGTKVTSKDARFQWEVMTSAAPVIASQYEKNVSSVDIVDDYTYVLHLKTSIGSMELGSSVYSYQYGWFQIPEHLFRNDFEQAKKNNKWTEFVDKVNKNPIMAGPYKVKEHVKGQYIVLEACNDFYMGKPNINRIILKIMTDPNAIFAATLTNELDVGRYALDFSKSLQLKMKKPDIYTVYFTTSSSYLYFEPNFSDPSDPQKPHKIFSDVRVRQALLSAIDRTQLNKILYQNQSTITDSWINELHFMHKAIESPTLKKYPYSVKVAEQLLQDAGWKKNNQGILEKDGTKFEITLTGAAEQPQISTITQIVQNAYKKIGILVTIAIKPANIVFSEILPQRKFDMIISGWGYGLNDEASSYWHSKAIPSKENNFAGLNYTGWSNKENDMIVDSALIVIDKTEKIKLYAKHLELWTEELPCLPILQEPTPHFAKKTIRSFSSGYISGLGHQIYNWYLQ